MILVNLNDSREIISTLLEGLPSMFMTTKSHGCNLFSALNVIHSLLKSSGGKIIVFQACPTISQIVNKQIMNTNKTWLAFFKAT